MQIKVTVENTTLPIHVIHLDGNLDAGTYQDFQSKADDLIAKGATRILVNLADVSFISSAGLRSLHGIFTRLRSIHHDISDEELRVKMRSGKYKSPYLKVCGLSTRTREIFQISGLDTYIETHKDTAEGILSFQ